ncbi:MAG: Nif11-like leader peptide family RiPP precursor [Betaproteobacteria bacterium]
MSLQSLQSFRKQVNGNAELESAVRGCLTGPQGALDLDALAVLGKRSGFDFSAEDVRAAMAATNDELSDLELEVVSAGGGTCSNGNSWA